MLPSGLPAATRDTAFAPEPPSSFSTMKVALMYLCKYVVSSRRKTSLPLPGLECVTKVTSFCGYGTGTPVWAGAAETVENVPDATRPNAKTRLRIGGLLLQFFVPARPDDFGVRTVGRAKFDGHGFRFRQNPTAMFGNLFRKTIPIIDLHAPVMDPRPRTGKLRFMGVLTVKEHEREIEIAVRHMTRDMLMVAPRRDLLEAEHIFIEARCGIQILDLYREMDDAAVAGLLSFLVPAGCDD